MASAQGYRVRLLRVNLTTGESRVETVDEVTSRKYVGGTAIGAKILYEEVPPEKNWSDPENRLFIGSGPLGGTRIGGSGTISVVTKGAMTNGATSTQANGMWGAFLRFCGYDGVVVQGAAKDWVYLYVDPEGKVELRDAKHLLGKDTWEMDEAIKQELGYKEKGMSVFGIGPAGENLVRFAAICGDRGHVAAHNGVGAVMGSKKLKAIAVARGKERVEVKDAERLSQISQTLLDKAKNAPGLNIYNWGTLNGVLNAGPSGWLPIKNYTTNIYPIEKEKLDKFGGPYIRSNFEPKPNPCWACQMHHCHIMKITEGPYTGEVVEEPEYEGFAAMGPAIGQTDVAAAMVLANETDRMGIDVNESGWVVAFAMECYEKGILTKRDTDGLEMTWGNAEAARALLRNIAHRRGLGNILAEGVMRAAQQIGGQAVTLAIGTQKGNSPRGHDHRTIWFEMFDTSVSNTGTIETHRNFDRKQLGVTRKMDPFNPDDVAYHVAVTKGVLEFEDSLGTCRFNSQTEMALLTEALDASVGWKNFTIPEAMEVGRRSVNMMRIFNLRSGISAEQDHPSIRYSSTPVDGPSQGKSIVPHWQGMLRSYYELMGWDPATGKPLPETLKSVGLEHLIKDIQ